MKTKIHLSISFFILIFSTIACGQNGDNKDEHTSSFSKFTCKYLTMDYPSDWKKQLEKDRLLFYLPEEPGRHLNSPSFHLTFQSRYALQNSKMFFEYIKDFPTPNKTYFKEEIAGKTATAYSSIGSSDVINIRYWFEVAPKKIAMIHIGGFADHMEQHAALFEKVKKSIQLIEQQPARKGNVTPVTNEQLAGAWQEKNKAMPGSLNANKSKFDFAIKKLWDGQNTILITDDSTAISDWNDFFAWKPFSVVKDVEIFSYYVGIGDQLRIFSEQVYLGDYDQLLIQPLKDHQLQFDFTKKSGEKVKWILEYDGDHNLPLKQPIDLDRFTFNKGSSFTHTERRTGEVITFAINGEKYTVKVREMQVF